ncbi:hypothetical protein ACERII_16585 [Evansella sp. AB-rgal1]|uniref:hypothetical protein n=1 Tax=Evansella sp. AB-rgal1 TaxID=3242696 RepID=UPI00359EBA10
MEKYIEVMKQSLELTETMLQGLQHIQKLIGEGKHEQTIITFEDVLSAYSTIENSIKPIKDKLECEQQTSTNLNHILELVVNRYEEKDYYKVQEVMQFTLIPQVKKWKEELENTFHPYIVS